MTGIEWLRSLHTKQLLELKYKHSRSLLYVGFVFLDEVKVTYQELKQVLSERPHIPNGAETTHIRKTAAKYKVRIYQSSN